MEKLRLKWIVLKESPQQSWAAPGALLPCGGRGPAVPTCKNILGSGRKGPKEALYARGGELGATYGFVF